MIEQYKPSLSRGDLKERVSQIQTLVGTGDDPLIDNPVIKEYLGVVERGVAIPGSKISTGRRAGHEEEDLREGIEIFFQLFGALAVDAVIKEHDETNSMDKAKQKGTTITATSAVNIFAEDIRLRFQGSSFERFKRRIGHRPVERYLGPLAIHGVVAGATSLALARASELSSVVPDITPAQGGALVFLWGFTHRTLTRNIPRQIGELFKGKANYNFGVYAPRIRTDENGEITKIPYDEYLPEHYAEDHLTSPLETIKSKMHDYKIDDRGEIEPMVTQVMQTAKELMYKSYGVEYRKDERPLYKKVLGRMAVLN